jgi:hypothetical protein
MCAVFFFLLLASCCCGFTFVSAVKQLQSPGFFAALCLSPTALQGSSGFFFGCYLSYSSLSLSVSLPTSFFSTVTLPKRSSSEKSGSEVPW